MNNCELCNRTNDIVIITKHHLIPKSKKGKNENDNYVYLCSDCHTQVHLLYDNNYLKLNLNTKEKLLNDKNLQKFAKFASKQISKINKKESKNKYGQK